MTVVFFVPTPLQNVPLFNSRKGVACRSSGFSSYGLRLKIQHPTVSFLAVAFTPGYFGANMEETTDLFGIPVPSTDKVFLTFVVVHILISLVCVISGLFAMLTEKGLKKHSTFGKVYFWSMVSAFATIVILSIMRWPHNIHLLSIGILAVTSIYLGYRLTKTKKRRWTRVHTVLMSSSYILLLTGFYVDNGKNLPFWKLFPQWFFWIFPAALGVPIILIILKRHPLNKRL